MKTDRLLNHKERVIAIGDIHGNYDLLKKMVEEEIKFNPEKDMLIFLGDYIDRGFNSMKVVLYLTELKEKYNDSIVLLMGNHELLALDYFKKMNSTMSWMIEQTNWFSNGGKATVQAFGNMFACEGILTPFISKLLPYYETDLFIFVHGGIKQGVDVNEMSISEMLWYRDNDKYKGIKTLVVGHTPVESCGFDGSVIWCDTGAFYSGKLSAFDVLSGDTFTAETAWKQEKDFQDMQKYVEQLETKRQTETTDFSGFEDLEDDFIDEKRNGNKIPDGEVDVFSDDFRRACIEEINQQRKY